MAFCGSCFFWIEFPKSYMRLHSDEVENGCSTVGCIYSRNGIWCKLYTNRAEVLFYSRYLRRFLIIPAAKFHMYHATHAYPPLGITHFMPWTTRTYGSCGTGPNTTSPSCRDACFSTTTPNSACLRSARWRRSPEPKSGRWRTTSPPRPTETRPHVRTSSLLTCQLLQELLWQQETQSPPWYRCKHSHNYCYDGHFLSLCLHMSSRWPFTDTV